MEEQLTCLTVHARPSFSCYDYPYSSPPHFSVTKKHEPRGFCTNKHCDLDFLTTKSLIQCPKCRHFLFWSMTYEKKL